MLFSAAAYTNSEITWDDQIKGGGSEMRGNHHSSNAGQQSLARMSGITFEDFYLELSADNQFFGAP
jgi:hypothetical protein